MVEKMDRFFQNLGLTPRAKRRRMRKISAPARILINSVESGRVLNLTERETYLVLKVWSSVDDKVLFSRNVMDCVLEAKPSLRTLFGLSPLEQSDEGSSEDAKRVDQAVEEAESAKIDSHCVKFANFWNTIIALLAEEEFEEVIMLARKVGTIHTYVRELSFEAQNWLVFKTCFLQVLFSSQFYGKGRKSSDVVNPCFQSWAKLFHFISSEIKNAFYDNVRSRKSSTFDFPTRFQSANLLSPPPFSPSDGKQYSLSEPPSLCDLNADGSSPSCSSPNPLAVSRDSVNCPSTTANAESQGSASDTSGKFLFPLEQSDFSTSSSSSCDCVTEGSVADSAKGCIRKSGLLCQKTTDESCVRKGCWQSIIVEL